MKKIWITLGAGLASVLTITAGIIAFVLIVVMGAVSAATQHANTDGSGNAPCVANYTGGTYANPLIGQLVSPFGSRANPFGPGVIPPGFDSEKPLVFHDGQDIAGVPEGTPYFSASSGTVKTIYGPGEPDGVGDGGNGIIIDAGGGVEFWYWHAVNGSAKVHKGDKVSAGQELAAVGSTGAATATHLHFQIDVEGKPVDPVAWMKDKGITLGVGKPPQKTTGSPSPPDSENSGTQQPFTVTGPNGAPMSLTAAQMTNAATIRDVGQHAGATNNDLKTALMVALQESRLQMLTNVAIYPESAQYPNQGDGHDNDSVNMFQQRHAAGWGSITELMDPVFAAQAFFGGPNGPHHGSPQGLLDIPNHQSLALGEAAQKVQGSQFPMAYDKWEKPATEIIDHLGGGTPSQCDTQANKGTVTVGNMSQTRAELIDAAKKGLGGQYIWGGTQFKAWDCSGYVKWVYSQIGQTLPRTEQWTAGTQTNDPQPGDLVVQIPDGPNHWAHVGIYAGNGMMYSALNPTNGTLMHPVDWNQGSQYFTFLKN